MISQIKEDFENLPSWARMLIGVGILFSIVKWFPIVELLELFSYIVIVPLGFLTFLGLVSAETTNGVVKSWNLVVNTIRERMSTVENPDNQTITTTSTDDTESTEGNT